MILISIVARVEDSDVCESRYDWVVHDDRDDCDDHHYGLDDTGVRDGLMSLVLMFAFMIVITVTSLMALRNVMSRMSLMIVMLLVSMIAALMTNGSRVND
jgi:hypothetical protein